MASSEVPKAGLIMNTAILQQAEQLFRAGRRQAAVDMLEEHMHSCPADRQAATVLGRIYVNLRQPERAAYWLRLSLQMDRQGVLRARGSEQPLDEPLGVDELDHIHASTDTPAEFDFAHEYGFDANPSDQVGTPTEPRRETDPAPSGLPLITADDDEVASEDGADFTEEDLAFFAACEESQNGDQEVLPKATADPLEGDYDSYPSSEGGALLDDEDLDELPPALEDAAQADEDTDWVIHTLSFDPLDTSEEDTLEELPVSAAVVSDYRKARQVAAELATEAGWSLDDLAKLVEVLLHHRSNAKTRAALRQLLIKDDVTPDELTIMHDLRLQWGGGGYNRCFRSGKAEDGWPNVSWQLALRLLRELQADSAEEILLFVEDCFQQWNDSPRMLNAFPIFAYYLNNVIEHMRRVAENCGERMPPYVDFDLFPDYEGDYDSWRLGGSRFPFGYSIDTVIPESEWL
ncbi:hypothetical protein MA04_03830 [Alcanivorax balearicus MACL04]|uniref:Tetratricopeptide repeat protein n=2 Tax=Alloalcanivorax balearicus TaxID=413232 RepID=A0ABT2R427_9GAMM|nr:hypothetical protein [Alloalcanivorax balearicus MACL04]